VVLAVDVLHAPEGLLQASRPAVVVADDTPLGEVETRFLETEASMVLLVDEEGQLNGVVTLHDLLRAQANLND